MILQSRLNHARDTRFGDVQVDIVRDHIAVIAAGKGRIAFKRLGKGDGKDIFGDGIVPFCAQKRKPERLHAVRFACKPRDCIHDRK